MTEKQERILLTALNLFATKGFDATSTNKVAKKAGVSEGLIFRHFTNKEGLLDAIMKIGKEKTNGMYQFFSEIKDPKTVIREVINMPFSVANEQLDFWKLLYSLKWQSNMYDTTMAHPIKELVIRSFKELQYENPEVEADVLMLILDGIAMTVLLKKPQNLNEIKELLLKKYNV